MNPDKFAVLLAGFFISISSLPVKAYTDFSECSLPKSIKSTKSLSDIPAPVLAQMPGLGSANGPILTDAFDPNDPKNDTIPRTRLAGAFSRDANWAVVYETGGFANTRMVAIFALTERGSKATLVGRHDGPQEGGFCAILKAAFPIQSKLNR